LQAVKKIIFIFFFLFWEIMLSYKMFKKIERWFYLQLQLILNNYFRRGNPFFNYNETHKKEK